MSQNFVTEMRWESLDINKLAAGVVTFFLRQTYPVFISNKVRVNFVTLTRDGWRATFMIASVFIGHATTAQLMYFLIEFIWRHPPTNESPF